MSNIWKRSLSMLLAVVMVLGMVPVNAFAAEETSETPICAEGHTWGLWEPTEDESGEYRACSVCGETETVAYAVVETEEEIVSAPVVLDYAEGEEPEPVDLVEAEGIVWMDKEKHNTSGNAGYFKGQIMKGNLDNIIRKAVGLDYADDSVKVLYDGMDVGNIYALAMFQDKLNNLQDELTNAVTYHQLVTFNVGGTDMDIAFRNILTVNIGVKDVTIESKGEPADLTAKIEAALDELEAGISVSHIFSVSVEKARAVVTTVNNSAAWPEAGQEADAAEVTVVIYDDVDGQLPPPEYTDEEGVVHGVDANGVTAKVILKDTRVVYHVEYYNNGECVLSQDVVEGDDFPSVADPSRTHYVFQGWEESVVDYNYTYTAKWNAPVDVNDNGIADQDETFTVTYVDEDGNELLTKEVAWGEATPEYNPVRKYYTLSFDKDVADVVTQDVTYTAIWTADLDNNDNEIADQDEFFDVTYHNVIFNDEVSGGSKTFEVKWGKATPAYTPSRLYYTFTGWDKVVASVVEEDAVYTATWKPTNDADGDGTPDEEEYYTITYVDEDGSEIDTYTIKWGEVTQRPADPVRDGGYRFGGWSPTVSATVKGDATYTATWTNKSIVTFVMGDFKFTQPVNETTGTVGNPIADTNDDNVVWDGWYCGDVKWDFNNEVTDDMTLVAVYYDDIDNDGLIDGTAEDPMITYVFMYQNWDPYEEFEIERETILAGETRDWLLEDGRIDTTIKYLKDTDDDGVIFNGWMRPSLNSDDPANLVYTYRTSLSTDKNNNGLADCTPEDPLHTYWFYDADGNLLTENPIDWLAGDPEVNPDDYVALLNLVAPYAFKEWTVEVTEGVMGFDHKYTAVVIVDQNKNGIEDGTAEDRIYMYDFMYGEIWLGAEMWMAGFPEVDTDKYVAMLNLTYPKVFVRWDVEPFDYGEGAMAGYFYTAVVIEDANDNGIDDSLEVDKLVLNTEIGQLVNGMLFDAHGNKIEVLNAEGENQLVQVGEELIFTLTNDTVIKVTPVDGYYVNDITIDGPQTAGWEVTYDEDYNATYAKASVYLRAGVANNDEANAYTVSIDLQPAQFEYKIADNNLVLDIDKVAEYDAQGIYDALIASPAYSDGNVTVEYLDARSNVPEEYRTVNLHTMIEKLVTDSNIVSAAKGFVSEKIVVDLGDAWVDVDAEPSAYYMTAEEAAIAYLDANGYLDENGYIIVDKLIAAVETLEDDLTNAVKENAMLHPFSYIEEGKEWDLRDLRITFENDKYEIVDDTCSVQLIETRSDVTIQAEDMKLSYYKVNDAALKNNVKVIDEDGNDVTDQVEVKVSYTKNIGNNTVNVEVPQSDAFKGAKATFTLTVTATEVSFQVPNVIVAMDEVNTLELGDFLPTVDPADFSEYIQLIAGVDMSALNLSLDKADQEVDLNDVQIKAWIKMNGLYNEILNAVGLGTGFYTVEEIKAKLAGSEMEAMTPAMDGIVATLEKAVSEVEATLYNKVGINYTMQITFEYDAYPTAAGAYINYVTTMDQFIDSGSNNYVGGTAYGYVVIHPLVVLPNNGIELFLNGVNDTQNVFEIVRNGENKNLGVAYNGSAVENDVFYFGFTTRGNVYTSKVGPNEAGIYLAASILYTENNEKLGSDMAAMIIAPSKANIEMENLVKVERDGEPHKITPTYTDGAGNAITEGVAVTMITGSVDVNEGTTNVGLSDISANLNIDFPKDLDDAWKSYVESRVDMPEVITVQTVLNFLDWCKTQIDTKIPVDTLGQYVNKDYIVTVQNYGKAACDKLIAELNKLPDVNATVTFADNKTFTDTGVYVYCGIITDPDLLPDANAGVLVIYSDETFLMHDSVKVYNGQEQIPDMTDTTNRGRIDVIVDRAAKYVNIMLDGDATKLVEKIEAKFGVTIDGNEIALQELYDRSGLKAEDLANVIIDYIWEQVPERLTNRFPGATDKVEEWTAKLEAKLPNVRTKLINKLVEIDRLPDNLTLAINKTGAVEIGTYEFHSFSYDIDYTTAMLEIVPNEIEITAENKTVIVGADSVEFTSLVKINGEDATDEQIAELNITYTLKDAEGNVITLEDALKTVGEYTIVPETTYGDEYNTVNIVEGILYVVEPVISNTGASLSLEGVVYMEFMVDLTGFPENIDFAKSGGVVVWTSKEAVTNREQLQIDADNCETLKQSMYYSDALDSWAVTSLGINAKEYGDEIYVRPFVELDDGTIIYAKVAHSSPQKYCNGRLRNEESKQAVKETCAALLEYGAAAQNLFDYKLSSLVNAGWDFTPYNIDFTVDMIDQRDKPTAEMANTLSGIKTSDISTAQASLALEGAIRIELGYDIAVENIATAEVLVWTEADYNAAETLAYDAGTYSYKIPLTWGYCGFLKKDCYIAESNHIPAKEIGDTLYFSVRVVTEDGTVYRGGLSYYSPDRYVEQHYENADLEIVKAVQTLAVYSEKARVLFNYFN